MELQLAELHFDQLPACNYSAIRKRAEEILGEELDAPDATGTREAYLLVHKQHPVRYSDGELPAQTAILAAHEAIDIDSYSAEIQQSWGFRDCESVLSTSRHTLLVTEMMARMLSAEQRVRLFHGVLQAVIEITEPDAIVFKHSQQVVHPDEYLSRAGDPPIVRPGSLNVRFFNISDSDDEMLMDTRGLTEIGLYDLQCHFRDLEPNDVSRVLFNTALYVFKSGAIIESGNTVAGIDPQSKWICQFEEALVEPAREVLDLNPGYPYAGGGRK